MSRRIAIGISVVAVLALVPGSARAGLEWHPIGPAPIEGFFSGGVTGRATAIAINPTDVDQVYLGTATGGVWFSPDAGQSWQPLSDKVESLSIGSLQVRGCDADGCATVYAGTGENAIRRDTYYGAGLLVGTRIATDPLTYIWQLRDGTASGFDFRGGSIVDVVLHPATSGTSTAIWIALSSGVTVSATEATVTAPEPVGGYGLYKSLDNGLTWSKLTVSQSNGAVPTSLRIDPQSSNTLYAGFLGRGVFKSTNGGASWCPLNPGVDGGLTCAVSTGLPDPTQVEFDHVEVVPTTNTFQPGSPTYLYASFGHCPDWKLQDCKPSLYKSTDAGATWQQTRIGSSEEDPDYPPACGTAYSRYTHGLTVSPFDHNIIYMAGIGLCSSGGSGAAAVAIDGNAIPGTGPGDWGNLIHLDHHAVAADPNDWMHLYSTSDGGFAERDSVTGVLHWLPRNDDLQITGFQTIASSPLTQVILGASQDNGGQLWTGSQTWDWKPCCGDGGYTLMDHDDIDVMFAGKNKGHVARSTDGGQTWTGGAYTVAPNDPWKAFYAPFVQDPTTFDLYYGGSRLWRSSDDAATWVEVSPVMSHSDQSEIFPGKDVISAIAVAPSQPQRLYVGYYGGSVWTTAAPSASCDDPIPPDPNDPLCDSPTDWTLVSQGLPTAPVTGIAVSPLDPLTAWVSFSGFGGFPRIWETNDAGASWTAADAGLPPGVPVNTIAVGLASPDTLVAGLDSNATGNTMWRRNGGSPTWSAWSNGLPNSPVYSVAVDHGHDRTLVATHGRGAFICGPPSVLPYEAWVEQLLWDLPIWAQELEPNNDCTIQVLQADGTACADSATDALGGTLRTDSIGRLVSSLTGMFDAMPLVWACYGGQCAGGVDLASCESIDAVQVSCGSDVASETLRGVQTKTGPASALMRSGVPTAAGAGRAAGVPSSFDLVASLHSGDGTTRSLCSVDVAVGAPDLPSDVVDEAISQINASPTCGGAGVRASRIGGDQTGGEDEFGVGPWLALEAPALAGTQLVPAIHGAPGESAGRCFELRALGLPVRGQLHVLSLVLETGASGAAGGEITVKETSGLGSCAVTVTTAAGQAPDDIAGAIAGAFQSPGIPGPHPYCPSHHNPRDISVEGDTLHSVVAAMIEVCVDDPGVGFFLKSEDLANAHPIAACSDTTVECTGPEGATVPLDGSSSSDPDSFPGTNDDLASYRWFLDYGTASQVFLGSGVHLDAPLSLGPHAVTLEVGDTAGLTDVHACAVSVVDTRPPTLSATVDPVLLWPPNHRRVDVTADIQTADLCSVPAVELTSLTSNEPDDAPGTADGETTNDIADAIPGTDDRAYRLRAERDGNGTGRSYTVSYRAVDGSGNETTVQQVAEVPLDVDGVVEPIRVVVVETPDGTSLSWTSAGAGSLYNVISGELPAIVDTGDAYDLGPVVCIEAGSVDTTTLGHEDSRIPVVDRPLFYLVEYEDFAGTGTGYGTESAAKDRLPGSGVCP